MKFEYGGCSTKNNLESNNKMKNGFPDIPHGGGGHSGIAKQRVAIARTTTSRSGRWWWRPWASAWAEMPLIADI